MKRVCRRLFTQLVSVFVCVGLVLSATRAQEVLAAAQAARRSGSADAAARLGRPYGKVREARGLGLVEPVRWQAAQPAETPTAAATGTNTASLTASPSAIADADTTLIPTGQSTPSPESTASETPATASPAPDTVTPSATATGSAVPTATGTSTATPTATQTETAAATATITATTVSETVVATEVVTETAEMRAVPGQVAELRSPDGRVRVSVPASAVAEAVTIRFRSREVKSVPATAYGLQLERVFDLNAYAVADAKREIRRFGKPLALSIDVTGEIPWPLPRGLQVWLGYYDEEKQAWVPFLSQVVEDETTGRLTLTAETDHFTTIGSGFQTMAGWIPSFNEPQTALFTGASTYSYPIKVPAGRSGVQPSLNVNYNSRAVDNIVAWTQGNWVGAGFDLDLPMITRSYETWSYGVRCRDRFNLQMDGVGYTLVPGNLLTLSDGTVYARQYHTQEESNLLIQRVSYDLSAFAAARAGDNWMGEFWYVYDGRGMRYRFGQTYNSEVVSGLGGDCVYGPGNVNDHGRYAGRNDRGGFAVTMWRLDRMEDYNQPDVNWRTLMEVTYLEETHPAHPQINRASYVQEIRYNRRADNGAWGTVISFDLADRSGNDGYASDAGPFVQGKYLSQIRVNNLGTEIGKYVFSYYVKPNASGMGGYTRYLTGVQEHGKGPNGPALPATTFGYIGLPNKGAAPGCSDQTFNCESFEYLRAMTITNGYGGETNFAYANDGRGWWMSKNYRVITRTIRDGRGNVGNVSYDYAWPCYNNNEGNWAQRLMANNASSNFQGWYEWDSSGAPLANTHQCPVAWPSFPDQGTLTGYGFVTVTVRDYNSNVLQKTENFFMTSNWLNQQLGEPWLSAKLIGRPYHTNTYNAAGTLLQQQETEYGFWVVGAWPQRWHIYPSVSWAGTRDEVNGTFLYNRTTTGIDGYGNSRTTLQYGAEALLFNSGFESPGPRDCCEAGWVDANGTSEQSSAVSFAGIFSRQLAAGTGVRGIYQNLSGLIPNQSYTARAWVRAAAGTAPSVRLYSGSNYGTPVTPITTSWQQITVTVTASGTGTAQLFVERYGSGDAAVYIDEVAVARAGHVGDERSIWSGYLNKPVNANITASWLMGLKWNETTYNGISDDLGRFVPQFVGQKVWYYDDYSYNPNSYGAGNSPISRGKVTMVGEGRCCSAGEYMLTRYNYNLTYDTLTEESAPYAPGATPRITSAGYDAVLQLHPTWMTTPLSYTTLASWDLAMGTMSTLSDPTGVQTAYEYDSFGRLIKIAKPGDSLAAPTTQYFYYDFELPTRVMISHIMPGTGSLPEQHFYDGLGREIQVKTESEEGSQNVIVHRQYNALGQLVRESAPLFRNESPTAGGTFWQYILPSTTGASWTETFYDALGRVTQVKRPDGVSAYTGYFVDSYTNMNYTPTGLWTQVGIDANGVRRETVTNGLGQAVRVREFTGTCWSGCGTPWSVYAQTAFVYDGAGRLTQVQPSEGGHTTIAYDYLGRKRSIDDPNMGFWSYAYNNYGMLETQTDARNVTLWFGYDDLNRLEYRRLGSAAGQILMQNFYGAWDASPANASGRRIRMDDLSGNTQWTYDDRGRVTNTRYAINNGVQGTRVFNVGHAYNSADQVIAITYPNGEIVSQNYRASGLPLSATGSGWAATAMTYDPAGRLTAMNYGNGAVLTQNYYGWNNQAGRLESIDVRASGVSTPLWRLQYNYFPNGNIQNLNEQGVYNNNQTQYFGYDTLNRLTSAFMGGGSRGAYSTQTYTYSTTGNLMSRTNVGTYGYGANVTGCSTGTDGMKPQAVISAGVMTFGYDCNGNMITRNEGGGNYVQTWNSENQLLRVTAPDGRWTEYTYDGDGNRVRAVRSDGGYVVYVGGLLEIENTPVPPTPTNTPVVLTSTATWTHTPVPPTNTPSGPTHTPTRTPTPTATTAGGGTTVTRQIGAGSDDVNEDGTTYTETDTAIFVGNASSTTASFAGLRFTGVNVPKNATITSAYLQITSNQTQWQNLSFTIQANNVDNSATFSSGAKPSSRSLTTQSVTHATNVQWTSGTTYNLTEMKTVVQAIVNRAGWTSGNAMSFILKGNGSQWARHFGHSYEGSPANAVRLVIIYTSGATSTPTRTPTATPTGAPAYACTGNLDTFTRANGAIGSAWSGQTANYAIASNQLDVTGSADAGRIIWNAGAFGVSQQACVKLAAIDTGTNATIQLVLKNETSNDVSGRLLTVTYKPSASTIEVSTYDSSNGWVQRGTTLTGVSFAAGNVFGARIRSNGMVEVYKGTTLLGTRDASGWSFINQTGYIGLRVNNGPAFLLDDFGGGTVAGGDAPKVLYKMGRLAPPAQTYTETPWAGEVWRMYYMAGGRPAAVRTWIAGGTNTIAYLHADHLGSIALSTAGGSASITSQTWFDPWGQERDAQANSPSRLGYTGQYRENSAWLGSLMNYKARYYSPLIGRFTSPDTIVPDPGNPQALNRYSYGLSNPLKYIDPSGHVGIPAGNCGPDGINCGSGANYDWDPGQMPIGMSAADKAAAEAAYDRFLSDPAHFAQLYLDPDAWMNSQEVAYLDLYLQYSTLHTSASRLLPTLFNHPAAAELAHTQYGLGQTAAGDEALELAVGPDGVLLGGYIFVAGANGVLVPVPDGWQGRVARSGSGMVYQQPGSVGNANSIRIMDPVTRGTYQYPEGYVRVYNSSGQPLTVNGLPGSHAQTHIPLNYQGPIRNWP